jgi:hypothetical protein
MTCINEDIDQREINREKRIRKHYERLGFDNPSCLICGESDPRCLQLDHIAGRAHSDDVWPICANDHARRTDFQKDHPPKQAPPREPLEVIGRFLQGLADFLELILTRLRDYGALLIAMAAASSNAP